MLSTPPRASGVPRSSEAAAAAKEAAAVAAEDGE